MFDLGYFMGRTGVDADTARSLTESAEALGPGHGGRLADACTRFMAELPEKMDETFGLLDQIARESGTHEYTIKYLFYAGCAGELLRRYRARGIDEAIFWDSMRDLTYKLYESINVHHVPGIFTGDWHAGFFNMTRFALGRMQFELKPFRSARYEKAGHVVSEGEPVLNMHIPSSGEPFNRQARLDSYRRAYRFFRGDFSGGAIPFVCASWLLLPEHTRFLPQGSNILDFMGDFEIISSSQNDSFNNGWRVFGDRADLPPEQLPRDTSLRRAYADWLLSGGKAGSGYGVFFFDGETII